MEHLYILHFVSKTHFFCWRREEQASWSNLIHWVHFHSSGFILAATENVSFDTWKAVPGGNDVIVKTLNIVWKWQPLFFAKYSLFQYDFMSQIFKYAISCHPLLQLIVQKLISIQGTVCHMCPNPTSFLMRKKWTAILLAVLALQPFPSLVEALMLSGIRYMVHV